MPNQNNIAWCDDGAKYLHPIWILSDIGQSVNKNYYVYFVAGMKSLLMHSLLFNLRYVLFVYKNLFDVINPSKSLLFYN